MALWIITSAFVIRKINFWVSVKLLKSLFTLQALWNKSVLKSIYKLHLVSTWISDSIACESHIGHRCYSSGRFSYRPVSSLMGATPHLIFAKALHWRLLIKILCNGLADMSTMCSLHNELQYQLEATVWVRSLQIPFSLFHLCSRPFASVFSWFFLTRYW